MVERPAAPVYGEPLDDGLEVRRLTEPGNIMPGGEVHEFAFRESGREDASVWETTRATRAEAFAIGGGPTRTASVLISVSSIRSVSVPYIDKDKNEMAYNPSVVWSDAGPSVSLGTPGREAHADIRPLVPVNPNVSNKQRKNAERFLRTELARHCRVETS